MESTSSDQFLADHFLSLPRPDVLLGHVEGVPDTSTLAAHDFDVDTRTGFMPPEPALRRLPDEWEPWESALDNAFRSKLQHGSTPDRSEEEAAKSASWRAKIRELPILPTTNLKKSELLLRRGHHVLAFIMHFYIHSLAPDDEIRIPPPVTIPLLEISAQLQLPPVTTYSDVVLYNWDLKSPSSDPTPALDNIYSQNLFTGTIDEQEFYLASARIELRGVEALELMREIMDEIFVGDAIAIRRITGYLRTMVTVVKDLERILLDVRKGCDPEVFYNIVRPWFRGADSDPAKRKWIFEGLEDHPELTEPTDLSGSSAGQSAFIHALDIFLGLENCEVTGAAPNESSKVDHRTLLLRMQKYMPRHHRNFLRHLSTTPRPLRSLVVFANDADLLDAYNAAVQSVKEFRDAHIRIVAIYIIGPARRARKRVEEEMSEQVASPASGAPLKGTGGTDLVQFLKGVRNQTAQGLIPSS